MSDKRIDDIVAMLDGSIEKGVGHLNVEVNGDSTEKSVETLGCIDCAKGNLACQVPTLHEGIDDALEE
ncbi:MAG: hypothetical protein K2M46_03150 [Lachnospiraceae bacterium]|nr:hypothetical protein [Lachnospiraceae bacterium]